MVVKGQKMTEFELEVMKKIESRTMVSIERCLNAINVVKEVNKNNVEGSIVECGVWKAGLLALMHMVDKEMGGARKVFGFDSFEYELYPTTLDEVNADLKKIGAGDISLHKGFFENSIPRIREEIGEISVLRLDASHYEATFFCLEQLYNKVCDGGIIIIDDYGDYEPCKKAVDDFREKNKINNKINHTDYTEIWWKKGE